MASLFASSHSTNIPSSVRQPLPAKSTPVDLASLQNASRVLFDQITKDAQIIPDIGDTLNTRTYSLPCTRSLFLILSSGVCLV